MSRVLLSTCLGGTLSIAVGIMLTRSSLNMLGSTDEEYSGEYEDMKDGERLLAHESSRPDKASMSDLNDELREGNPVAGREGGEDEE